NGSLAGEGVHVGLLGAGQRLVTCHPVLGVLDRAAVLRHLDQERLQVHRRHSPAESQFTAPATPRVSRRRVHPPRASESTPPPPPHPWGQPPCPRRRS